MRKNFTIADLQANKGKHQYKMMRVTDWDEPAAADAEMKAFSRMLKGNFPIILSP